MFICILNTKTQRFNNDSTPFLFSGYNSDIKALSTFSFYDWVCVSLSRDVTYLFPSERYTEN